MKYIVAQKVSILLASAITFSLVENQPDNISLKQVVTYEEKEALKPTCDMVAINKNSFLYDAINGDIEEIEDEDKLVFQIAKSKNWSLIRYNDEVRYIKNEDITILPYLYKEIVKNDITDPSYIPKYINKKCMIYENIGNGELATFDKYSKVYAIFQVGEWTCINMDGATGYVESKYLSNLDYEYSEAIKYPDRTNIDSYVYINDDTKIKDVTLGKWQCAYALFEYNGQTLIKYEDKYYYVPSKNITLVGDSFIDVDLSGQYVKMFKNGELKVSGDCVTGNTITPTDEGFFDVFLVDGQRYLSGYNLDGSRYKVPVDCFIAFNGGIGFHNVTYRTSAEHFAKDLYLTGKGSHGCVNMYKKDVLKMYNELKSSPNSGIGYKVLVHK